MARSRSIGNVYAELSVKDKMTVGLKRASKSLNAFGDKMLDIGKMAVFAAPAAAVAGIVVSMKSAIDAGGKLSDMMAQTGADGEGLFVMQRAFENAGIAGDKVPGVLNKMQKALAGVNEEGQQVTSRVFSDLGLSIPELRNMDAGRAFRAISESIARIPDPAKRAALAMEIFGRSGGELLVLMNDGAAFAAAAEQVGGLGKTLSENANRLDAVSDSLTLLGTKAQQVGAEVAVALLPQLEDFSNKINETDLAVIGQAFGIIAVEVANMAEAMAMTVQQIPGIQKLVDLVIPPNLSEADKARAASIASGWAETDSDPRAWKGKGTGGAVSVESQSDPFALPPGAEEAARNEWRQPAPFISGEKDKKLLEELRKQTKVLESAQAGGSLTW
jgi:hypothetical protein